MLQKYLGSIGYMFIKKKINDNLKTWPVMETSWKMLDKYISRAAAENYRVCK
jgi:hypothetical protein